MTNILSSATKEEWHWSRDRAEFWVYEHVTQETVARVLPAGPRLTAERARLIAQAPALLRCAESAVRALAGIAEVFERQGMAQAAGSAKGLAGDMAAVIERTK